MSSTLRGTNETSDATAGKLYTSGIASTSGSYLNV